MNIPNDLHLPSTFPTAEKRALTIGFIPLLDSAPVIVAKEFGFFDDMGLDVTLSRESSWASIRDKVQFGLLDAAPIPAGIVLASAMKIGTTQPMVTAMSLGLNGNAITVSTKLWEQLNSSGKALNSLSAAQALKAYLTTVDEPVSVASVHTYSTHHFLLREWLAEHNIDPDNKLKQHVVPPSHMIGAMQRGIIDIFCAGEPWNSLAQTQKIGHTLLSGHQIWENAPDKVLGVTRKWHETNPISHQRLIAALLKACMWLDSEENTTEGFMLLKSRGYLNENLANIDLHFGRHCFSIPRATFPNHSHAQWFIQHINQLSGLPTLAENALLTQTALANTYLTDIYQQMTESLNIQ
jgi:nitrate/nitrite transport system substrate-binding protein